MAIKITLNAVPSLFTKMRVYRSTNSALVFDESKFLEEVAAATTYTDSSTTREVAAKAFYYGFRFSTEGGIIQDVGPFTIRNLFDLDYLHCYDLPHPFKLGNASFGMYHTDSASEFTPSSADVIALIRAKFPTAVATAATDVRRVIAINGNLYLWGAPFVTITQTYNQQIAMIANYRKNNMEQPQDESWKIIRNGVKWELTMLLQDELSAAGKFINGSTVGDIPISPQTLTLASQWAAPVPANDLAYAYVNGVNPDGSWLMTLRTASTSTVTANPTFVMKYVGRV